LDKATLAFCILINQRQRNRAIGIKNDTTFLRGLGHFMRNSHKDQLSGAITTISRAMYLKAMIEECQSVAKKLTRHIMDNLEDADTRNEGVYAMTKLESYINYLGEQLGELWRI